MEKYSYIIKERRAFATSESNENMKISKELLKGSVSLMILKIIDEGDAYGYQISKKITERSEQLFRLTEGSLYPILHLLEKEGLVSSYRKDGERGRDRKYYAITAPGKLMLSTRMEEWQMFSTSVNRVLKGEK